MNTTIETFQRELTDLLADQHEGERVQGIHILEVLGHTQLAKQSVYTSKYFCV